MRYILFVCTHNAGRSQMAQAFFERYGPDDVRAESAGPSPAARVHPVVVEAMREVGIDLSGRHPRRLLPEMQLHADWAVTLACGARCPYVPGIVEDWDIADPAGLPIEQVRPIRDEIEQRVRDLIYHRIGEIHVDDRAHQARVVSLLGPLIREYGDRVEPESIRACADAILARYADAPVRGFVQPIALREARHWLRRHAATPVS